MASRIPWRRLPRVAQCQGLGSAVSSRPQQHCITVVAPRPTRLELGLGRQFFSSSPAPRQDPKSRPDVLPPSPAETFPSQGSKRKPFFSLKGRRWISAAVFLLIGTAVGSSLRIIISPPTPPAPGTEEDRYATEVLHQQAAKLPLVLALSEDPRWTSWEAYDTLTPEHKAQHITAGALSGSRGVGGYQRIFYDGTTGELISIIFLGPAITGWPGVVHGGCLATLLDESCGRAAFKHWGGRSGVTANLIIEYKGITLANGFYAIHVRPRPDDALPENERGKRHYKCFVDASIADAITGKTTVTANAIFIGGEGKKPVTKGLSLPSWGGTTPSENQQF